MTPDYARNMRLLGHSDQGGRPDGVQIMVHRGYAYIGHDIRDPYRPVAVAALVPPAPTRLADHRPGRARVIQSADVFVDASGVVYCTDYNAGLYTMEYGG